MDKEAKGMVSVGVVDSILRKEKEEDGIPVARAKAAGDTGVLYPDPQLVPDLPFPESQFLSGVIETLWYFVFGLPLFSFLGPLYADCSPFLCTLWHFPSDQIPPAMDIQRFQLNNSLLTTQSPSS